jgi:hypothetical protein
VIPISRGEASVSGSVQTEPTVPTDLSPAGVAVNRSFESQRSGGPLFPPTPAVERRAAYPPPLSPNARALKETTDAVIGKGLVGQRMTWPEPPPPPSPAPVEAWLPLPPKNVAPVNLTPFEPHQELQYNPAPPTDVLTAAENEAKVVELRSDVPPSSAFEPVQAPLQPELQPAPVVEPGKIEQVVRYINGLVDTVKTQRGQLVTRRRYEAVTHADETGATVISVYRWDEARQGGVGDPLTTEQFNEELASHAELEGLTALLQGRAFRQEMQQRTEQTRATWQRSELAHRYETELATAATAVPRTLWDRIRTRITPLALGAKAVAASAITEARHVGSELQTVVRVAIERYREQAPVVEQRAEAALAATTVPERDRPTAEARHGMLQQRLIRVTDALSKLLKPATNPLPPTSASSSSEHEVAA